MNDAVNPLLGIRVLDLATEQASFCSKLLADMGAFVIKVEKPPSDQSRQETTFPKGSPIPEERLFYWYFNVNKYGITLDIENVEGMGIFKRLINVVDVVVETYFPGYLDGLHLGFNDLKELNPNLILASVTGFGQTGPKRNYEDGDFVISAFGGQMFVTGSSGKTPLCPYGSQSFYVTSLFSAVAILLALQKRRISGQGDHIDISSQEAVASTLEHVMVRYFHDHVVPKRSGGISWNGGSFISRCKDGHIHINIVTQWETLVEWLNGEGMAEDLIEEEWKDASYRLEHIQHVIQVVQHWTEKYSMGELFESAQALRFPWGPVYAPSDIIHSPQLKERGFFVKVEHPEPVGLASYPGIPWRFYHSRDKKFKKAPFLGEDNQYIYHDFLGLSQTEIERLAEIKAI